MQPQWCNDFTGTFPAGSKPSSRCTEFECVYSYVYARDRFLDNPICHRHAPFHPFVVLVIELDDILVAALFPGYGGGFRRKLDKE